MISQSLEALQELQAVESKLRGLKQQLKRKEKYISQQELQIRQQEEQIIAKSEEIKHRQTQVAKLELECKTRETEISKLQVQLNSAKSNKEYSTLLTQLNTARADNAKIEEQILQELSEIDSQKKELEEMKQSLDNARSELQLRKSQVEQESAGLKEQIAKLEKEYEEIASRIPREDLKVFERVAEHHDGEALAEVLKPEPKAQEYICSGCYMSIPLERVNSLLTRQELQICNNCGRILYMPANQAEETKK